MVAEGRAIFRFVINQDALGLSQIYLQAKRYAAGNAV
jgi:restriction endonuclease Mrr